MTPPGFVLVAARAPDQLRALTTAWQRATPDMWRSVPAPDGLWLAVRGAVTALPAGMIVGPIFQGGRPLTRIVGDAAEAIAATRGASLGADCWGHYVAILFAGDGDTTVLRAPLGRLPCYHVARDGVVALSSSVRALHALGLVRPRLDAAGLAAHLAFAHLAPARTCLADVIELRGGARWTIGSDGLREDQFWLPWPHAMRARRDDPAAAIAAVIGETAPALVPPGRLLLKLSGGLDSSILAAALAAAGREVHGLTLFTDDRSGDERGEAQRVARHLDIPLTERERDPADIDLASSPAAHLARPGIPLFRQHSDVATARLAAALGATAVVDGGGGDNVFCSLRSVAPVVDALRQPWGRSHAVPTARTLAELAGVSLLDVARATLRRWARSTMRVGWPRETALLAPDVVAELTAHPDHAWLDVPAGALPGQAAHVGLMIAAQSYVETSAAVGPPLLSPLLAQPVVERCLAVPSWAWFADGHDRVAARRAFADRLPHETVWRRAKGSPDAFVARILEQHRAAIADRLLDGQLARLGLIARETVAAALADPRPPDPRTLARLMALLDAELWATSWVG